MNRCNPFIGRHKQPHVDDPDVGWVTIVARISHNIKKPGRPFSRKYVCRTAYSANRRSDLDQKFNLLGQFADCFDDFRNPELIKHSARELLAQRIFGIALGYEDLNDHEQLRHDPLMAVLSLAKNARLTRVLGKELHLAEQLFQATGKPARVFKDFEYKTQKS